MTYAHRDDIYDADTHMMEHPDWLASFADAEVRPHIVPINAVRAGADRAMADAIAKFKRRRADAEVARAADAVFMSSQHKGWHGLGAFDAEERRHVNDLMGFKAHIVFPTEAFNQAIAARDADVRLGSIRALNRGLAAFCGVDARMYGTGYVPLGLGPEIAGGVLDELIAAGFRVVLVDTIAPEGGHSFTHADYDRIWGRIAASGLCVVLHIGADGRQYRPVPTSFFANGRGPAGAHGVDGPRGALHYMAMQYNAELFLAAMIFDGVLERFPGLRIGVVELGASWIISWMKQLDQAHRAFRRVHDFSQLRLKPSEYVQRQVKVTPFAGEDIGWLLASGAEDLLMFATDYPHGEGTDDPIGRFERTMATTSEARRRKFYTDNFRALVGV